MARPKEGYKLADGTPVPGVTTIIKTLSESEGLIHWAWKLGKSGEDYRKVKQKAADIGSVVHDTIEAHLRRESPPVIEDPSLAEKVQRAFAAWRDWFDTHHIVVQAFERPLVSERHGYGGTIDAIGLDADSRFLITDWKTSKGLYPEYLAQLGGYAILLAENGIASPKGAVVLRADKEKDMTWEVIEMNLAQLRTAGRAFLAALGAYKAREQLKDMMWRRISNPKKREAS